MRIDIQALRGLAVSLVVLQHFRIGPFSQGFLGVDVFFVISGYLIVGLIARDTDQGVFTLVGFYARRARRILPSAYLTILMTILGASLFLNSIKPEELTYQVIGAAAYVVNIILYYQVGYFDLAADSKPLLHMWSLAIEEQFYIIVPALLLIIPRNWWAVVLAVGGLLSLFACLYLAPIRPSFAFYMLQTRAWELLIGAFGSLSFRTKAVPTWTTWPALMAILVLSVLPLKLPHPGIAAVLVCTATLVILIAESDRLARSWLCRAMARIGDISYTLYLVHWPVVVFLTSAAIVQIKPEWRYMALILAVILAILMHVFVEQPLRFVRWRWPTLVGATLAGGAILGASQFALAAHNQKLLANVAHLMRPNYGLDMACDNYQFTDRPVCQTAVAPETLVWGDSYAEFTAWGLRHTVGGIVQATYSGCPAFIGYALLHPARDDKEQLARYCMAFNDQVLAGLDRFPSLKTIVLAGSFAEQSVTSYTMLRRAADGSLLQEQSSPQNGAREMTRIVRELKSRGLSVVVAVPPPIIGSENVNCAERVLTGKIAFGANIGCTLSEANARAYSAPKTTIIAAAQVAGAQIIDVPAALCDGTRCRAFDDGVILYRDSGHLSYDGVDLVYRTLASRNLLPSLLANQNAVLSDAIVGAGTKTR